MPVDPMVVREFAPFAVRRPRSIFAVVRPRWNSDIRWIGPKSMSAYSLFDSAFRRLGVANHIEDFLDIDQEPRLYSGFLVTRRICRSADFHVDWQGTDRQAYTMMTPISGNAEGFGLIYRDDSGSIRHYVYRLGEAILFSDGFVHSTRPGQSEEDVALLCFTFGTDKMRYWERIRATSASQSVLMCRPDGQFIRIGAWHRLRRKLGWLANRAGLRRSA